MIISKTARLFAAALTLAAGIGVAGAAPAAAAPSVMRSCLEFNQADWQYNSVGNNRAMSSCVETYDYTTGLFTAYTQVISTSYWTGFHGCVRLEFIDTYTGGTVVHTSAQQRWGVSAGHRRLIEWSSTMPPPNVSWNSRRFVHWRC
ncbi:hypothetical protein [Allorhizocola rhizosphaerae]|uniref:hypothetical protein n=1 Tax=Allorhizocola rhizosphaerae TaxID=1872709 RepID=UPI000E3BB3B3|nr:hypothetical protein [Allorhizocola rhizosphaerae]